MDDGSDPKRTHPWFGPTAVDSAVVRITRSAEALRASSGSKAAAILRAALDDPYTAPLLRRYFTEETSTRAMAHGAEDEGFDRGWLTVLDVAQRTSRAADRECLNPYCVLVGVVAALGDNLRSSGVDVDELKADVERAVRPPGPVPWWWAGEWLARRFRAERRFIVYWAIMVAIGMALWAERASVLQALAGLVGLTISLAVMFVVGRLVRERVRREPQARRRVPWGWPVGVAAFVAWGVVVFVTPRYYVAQLLPAAAFLLGALRPPNEDWSAPRPPLCRHIRCHFALEPVRRGLAYGGSYSTSGLVRETNYALDSTGRRGCTKQQAWVVSAVLPDLVRRGALADARRLGQALVGTPATDYAGVLAARGEVEMAFGQWQEASVLLRGAVREPRATHAGLWRALLAECEARDGSWTDVGASPIRDANHATVRGRSLEAAMILLAHARVACIAGKWELAHELGQGVAILVSPQGDGLDEATSIENYGQAQRLAGRLFEMKAQVLATEALQEPAAACYETALEYYLDYFGRNNVRAVACAVQSVWNGINAPSVRLTMSEATHLLQMLWTTLYVVEDQRGDIEKEISRQQLAEAEEGTYETSLQCVNTMAARGLHAAPNLGLWLIESRRRAAIAELSRNAFGLPDHIVERIDELRVREAHCDLRSGGEVAGEVDELRAEIAEDFGYRFADVVIPPVPVSTDRLSLVGDRNLLCYWLTMQDDNHTLWMAYRSAAGRTSITRRVLSDAHRALLTDPEALYRLWWRTRATSIEWTRLAEALLPDDLADDLTEPKPRPLLIVPSGALSTLPLGALQIDGRPLATLTPVSLTPSLQILRSTGNHSLRSGTLKVRQEPGEDEAADRSFTELTLSAALASEQPAAVLIDAHGRSHGSQARLDTVEGSLSAVVALDIPWPPVVVAASCWVGALRHEPFSEPISLPVACLLRGADHVIAGLSAIDETASRLIATQTCNSIERGLSPSLALHQAQSAYHGANPDAPAAALAGLALWTAT